MQIEAVARYEGRRFTPYPIALPMVQAVYYGSIPGRRDWTRVSVEAQGSIENVGEPVDRPNLPMQPRRSLKLAGAPDEEISR